MNPEVKDWFVAHLRNPENKQAYGQLRAGDRCFCAIGLLCDIYDRATGADGWAKDINGDWYYQEWSSTPSEKALEWAGLTSDQASDIITLNDHETSFADIADYVERTL